jgi:4-hydroxybutyrate CoA-transferase
MLEVEDYIALRRREEPYVACTSKEIQEEYHRKLISAEDAAKMVKPGMWVSFTSGREARTLGLALAARKEELHDVHVFVPTPTFDFRWYDGKCEDSFRVTTRVISPLVEEGVNTGRIDFDPGTLIPFSDIEMQRPRYAPDILFVELSPPDEKGYCSFGNSVWAKKRHIRQAKLVIGETNKNLIRTYGDNFIHMSEMDYFVEHVPSGRQPKGTLMTRDFKGEEHYHKAIAKYVKEIIKDGDTLQIGAGRTTEPLVGLGIFEDKNDIGYHSELAPPGIIRLVQQGVVNGKWKTINRGKVVVTAIGGGTTEQMNWVNMNPLFWVVDETYLEDVRIIAAHDNFVAINNILSVDLTGQATSESLGTYQRGVQGGQLAFTLGASLSRGGRSIQVTPSVSKTKEGKLVSRVVRYHPEGTVVTVPRTCVDYVVTEYGVARLKGKTIRERCSELISIAHPEFRAELQEYAKRRYGLRT